MNRFFITVIATAVVPSVRKLLRSPVEYFPPTVRKKGVLARGQNCQKEESGNHQNNRFVTIATDAQL